MNVHPFGCNVIPINPDNVPENDVYGQGSERPIGFNFSDIFKLVWTVRSFLCSFSTISQNDPLSQFLSGGGAFNIQSAIASLNGINLGGNDSVTGYTSISTAFKQKERTGTRSEEEDIERTIYTWDGIIKGQTITKISLGLNQKTFVNTNKTVYEGNLIIGPVHTITGKVIIDFSNIKYYRGLYWPRVVITTNNASSVRRGPQLFGGILFYGKLVNMYSINNDLLNIAFGEISVGKRCCDRFYYDGKDKIRTDTSSCPDCQKYKDQYKMF